jgi:hypothetical protein
LIEFQQRYCDEAACAEYLFAARWPVDELSDISLIYVARPKKCELLTPWFVA